jgi:hypothetical protein
MEVMIVSLCDCVCVFEVEGAGDTVGSRQVLADCRNITWIAECIAMNQRDKIMNYISVF